MRVGHLQRKCALIEEISKLENWPNEKTPAWPSKTNEYVTLLGITRTAFQQWADGRVAEPKPSKLEECDRTLKKFLQERGLEGFDDSRNLLSDDVGVMELGRFLGLTRLECRRAIDTLIGRVAPTFSIFSHHANEIKSLERSFQGLSFVYRAETTLTAEKVSGRKDNVLRMPLSVRYPIDSHKVMAKGLRRMRCRLQVQSYSNAEPNHQYDGYMTKKDGGGKHHHWFFQSRIDQEADVIYMLTLPPQREQHDDPMSRRYILGLMFSRTQDENPVAAVWPVVILPLTEQELATFTPEESQHEDAETMVMKDGAALLPMSEVEDFALAKLREAESLANFFVLPKLP